MKLFADYKAPEPDELDIAGLREFLGDRTWRIDRVVNHGEHCAGTLIRIGKCRIIDRDKGPSLLCEKVDGGFWLTSWVVAWAAKNFTAMVQTENSHYLLEDMERVQ